MKISKTDYTDEHVIHGLAYTMYRSSFNEFLSKFRSLIAGSYAQGMSDAGYIASKEQKQIDLDKNDSKSLLSKARESFVSGDTAVAVKLILDYLQKQDKAND